MVISTKCYHLEIKGGICLGRFSCFGKTSETSELIQFNLNLFKSDCVCCLSQFLVWKMSSMFGRRRAERCLECSGKTLTFALI